MTTEGASFKSLDEVRATIDALDRVLVTLLAERLRCIVAAAHLKESPDHALVPWRVEDVVTKVREQAGAVGFDPDLAEDIWRGMMERCITHERRVLERAI